MYIKDRYIHMLNLRFSDFYMSPTALVQLSAFLKDMQSQMTATWKDSLGRTDWITSQLKQHLFVKTKARQVCPVEELTFPLSNDLPMDYLITK